MKKVDEVRLGLERIDKERSLGIFRISRSLGLRFIFYQNPHIAKLRSNFIKITKMDIHLSFSIYGYEKIQIILIPLN